MAKASTKPASSVSQIILTKNFLICDLVSSGVDPYAGRKKITEEARIREDVKRDLLQDLKQLGWKAPGGGGVQSSGGFFFFALAASNWSCFF